MLGCATIAQTSLARLITISPTMSVRIRLAAVLEILLLARRIPAALSKTERGQPANQTRDHRPHRLYLLQQQLQLNREIQSYFS